MKKISLIYYLLIFLSSAAYSQEFTWRTGLFTFFDNTEFGQSEFKVPQTMAGVMIAPEAGLVWDSVQMVNAGISMMHEFGSLKAFDRICPTAYYTLYKGPLKFNMGAFPRSLAVERYPRLFFQDSISYYRPNINGILLELGKNKSYINLWLDWTGRKSDSVREAFFIGYSGRFTYNIFYVQHFGYIFHFAEKLNPVVYEALHDNLLFQTSAGIDLSGKTGFNKLEVNAGWIVGLERARTDNSGWISRNGLLVETKIEYRFLGLFNSFYKGSGLMNFYKDHGHDLYWGDPAYRAITYNRSDFYLKLLNNRTLDFELTYSLHFLESRIYHEQLIKLRVNLNKQ
jgi:hypothetical protein